jgi:DNA-binding PadR family transcriptional regulator
VAHEPCQRQGCDHLGELSDEEITLQRGNVYPALNKLQMDGLVKCKKRKSNHTNRERQLWSLTPQGRREAERHRKAVLSLYMGDR